MLSLPLRMAEVIRQRVITRAVEQGVDLADELIEKRGATKQEALMVATAGQWTLPTALEVVEALGWDDLALMT